MLFKLLCETDRTLYQPIVLALAGGGYFAERIEALGIPVCDLGMRLGLPSPIGMMTLRRKMALFNPDLIHAWMYHATLAALIFSGNRPVIAGIRASLHDTRTDKFATRQVISAVGRLSARAARICYNSRTSMTQHIARGYAEQNAEVIGNGFDCGLFAPDAQRRASSRASLGIEADRFVVGHVARHHPVKDHDTILKAFAIFAREHPLAILAMAGSGVVVENQQMGEEIKRLGIGDKVLLLGECDDTPALFNAFDVLANSSRSEAFPNVLGEAMASGVPCVATDVGDTAMVIGTCGHVVPPADPEALAQGLLAVVALSSDAYGELARKARRRIETNFPLERVAAQYAALYEDVCLAKPA